MLLPDLRVRQRDYLLEISRAMTQELDLEKLLARILMISIEMLAGQAGLIALRDELGDWHVPVSHGLPRVFLDYLLLISTKSLTRPIRTNSNYWKLTGACVSWLARPAMGF